MYIIRLATTSELSHFRYTNLWVSNFIMIHNNAKKNTLEKIECTECSSCAECSLHSVCGTADEIWWIILPMGSPQFSYLFYVNPSISPVDKWGSNPQSSTSVADRDYVQPKAISPTACWSYYRNKWLSQSNIYRSFYTFEHSFISTNQSIFVYWANDKMHWHTHNKKGFETHSACTESSRGPQ